MPYICCFSVVDKKSFFIPSLGKWYNNYDFIYWKSLLHRHKQHKADTVQVAKGYIYIHLKSRIWCKYEFRTSLQSWLSRYIGPEDYYVRSTKKVNKGLVNFLVYAVAVSLIAYLLGAPTLGIILKQCLKSFSGQ